MAANLFQPSLSRALDSNGNPVSNAKMYFYLTGTTTPATWYTNQAGTVAGTNPLTAGSTGLFAPAYLDPDTTYRIVLKTSDGATTIWDVDPVRGFDETQLVDDAATASAAATDATTAKTQALAAQAAAEAAQAAAVSAKNGAIAAVANATDYYPGARSYVPQGAITGAATISTAGTGGTNGTFDLAFSGGNFSVNPTGTFTVTGGAVTAITITGPGLYVGNAISKPTLSFAASTGLTGAAGTFNTAYLKTAGQYYLTDHASDGGKVALFQNQANAAVEVDASVDPFSVGAAQAAATAAAASAVDATNNGAAQVALATTQATNAASSAAAAAATAATVGALSSQSIKFPDAALQVAGQFGVLKQSRTNMPAIMNAADSHVIMMWETPQEKNGQNAGFRLFGNSITGTNNLQFYCLMNGSSTNDSGGNAGKLSWHHRNSGVSLNLVGPEIPVTVDRWVGKVSRTVVGADTLYTFDAWNTTDGTKYTGTTQTNPAGVVGIAAGTLSQTHWYIGHADTVAAEPTINTALTLPNSGASDMGIEFLGFYNGAITDTNMQNIALGADPLVELTAANFGYYRRFRGTDSASLDPVAGTGDTTPATTVLGSVNPGGNLRRQGLTNYLTLDRKVDGFVHGCRKGELGQQVQFSGSLAGTAYSAYVYVRMMPDWGHREVKHENGYIWGRVVLRDGSAWVPWTKLARLVNSATEGLTFVERSRFAVGVKVAVLGQSQVEYALGSAGTVSRTLNRTITGGPGGSIIGRRWDNVAYPIYNQVRVFDGNVTWSDAGAAMIDTLSAAFGCPVCIVNLGQSGTDSREWIKTAGTRLWSDTVTTLALAGSDISALVWQWYTNMANTGSSFGSTILDATIKGTGSGVDTNWVGNGLFRQGFSLGISGYTRTSSTAEGPFDNDANTGSGIPEARLSARQWAAENGVAYGPEIIDMQIDSAGGPHEAGTVYGTVRLGLRLAECALRALGASSLSDGSLGTPVFNGGKTTITLTATLPNIGGLRVDDTATYSADVQGFEISTNGGTTWSRSGFTAALGATPATRNQVILTKTTGDWTAVAAGQMRVRYAWGGPLAYGKSLEASLLIRGLLYDGCDREGGLGFPIQPLAPTVVS